MQRPPRSGLSVVLKLSAWDDDRMDSRLLPEPDSDLGYSESQLASILGHRIEEFHEYMLMKTYALAQDGSAVYYPGDVHRYVEHYMPPRARRLTERDVYEILTHRWSESGSDNAVD